MKIPILSYVLRKIKENQAAIKKAQKTGKKTGGEIKKSSFLWIFKIASGKSFEMLKLKKKKK